jgi:putative nucleotidyltransferase with HDIG domain
MRAPSKARALIAGTLALGAGTVVSALVLRGDARWTTLALLGAAAILTETVQVPSDETSPDAGDAHSFSLSSGVHYAAVIMIGPWTGALIAVFGVVVADRLRGVGWRFIAFNASVFAVAVACGGLAYELTGGTPGALHLPNDFVPVVALAAVAFALNTAFQSAIVAFETGTPLAPLAREAIRDGLTAAPGEAAFGVALAFFALTQPWGVVALVPLVYAVYRSYERLAALRRETAHALETFANVVDERDSYTFQHSARVAEYVTELAHGLELTSAQVARLRWAGRLHDLGKVAVDASVLRKPGKLDEDEWTAMRLHPRLSARLLRRFRFAGHEARAVEYHHERADGKGYYGIEPRQIPLAAHFLIVADSYDAMTSDRPYRAGLDKETALGEIERNAGTQFHPALAKAFVALQRGEDPLAALSEVELNEIRRLAGTRSKRGFTMRRLLSRLDLAITAGTVMTLSALGLGLPLLALGLGCAAAAAAGLRTFWARQAAHLARRLEAVLARAGNADSVFSAVTAELRSSCSVQWAGLVSWSERDCTGELRQEWTGGAEAPSQTTLMSWLLREYEAPGGFARAEGRELGRADEHAALRLGRNGVLEGFLVLAVPGGLPVQISDALAVNAAGLAERLLAPETEASTPHLRVAS